MSDNSAQRPLVRLPAPGARVVVRYLIPTGQATDALGQLLSVDDGILVVDGVRGVVRIPMEDIVAAKQVPPRAPRRTNTPAPDAG